MFWEGDGAEHLITKADPGSIAFCPPRAQVEETNIRNFVNCPLGKVWKIKSPSLAQTLPA